MIVNMGFTLDELNILILAMSRMSPNVEITTLLERLVFVRNQKFGKSEKQNESK